MLIKVAILVTLFMPSIMATLSKKDMTDTLIKAEDEDLVKTFKKFKEEQNSYNLSCALGDVAQVPEHIPKVVTCLRTVVDPFPTEMSRVSRLVHFTLTQISNNTRGDTESFAKIIASFESSDVKPLASIRYWTIWRNDARDILESVLKQSFKLVTDDLPRWLANHSFDQNSRVYNIHRVVREQTFQYLASFATEGVLTNALSIVKANEHFKANSDICCCNTQDSFPQGLYNKLNDLLIRLQHRKAVIKNELQLLLPSVLVELVLDHVQVTEFDSPIPSPDIITQASCLIL